MELGLLKKKLGFGRLCEKKGLKNYFQNKK